VLPAAGGGTCVLGGGRYDRPVDQQAFSISTSATIQGDPLSTTPAVLDGSTPINTTWSLSAAAAAAAGDASGAGGTVAACVYSSAPLDLDGPVWQLWATGLTRPPLRTTTSVDGGDPFYPHTDADFDGFLPLTPARCMSFVALGFRSRVPLFPIHVANHELEGAIVSHTCY
jgi:hypothetical protein